MAVEVVKNNYEIDTALVSGRYCVVDVEWQQGKLAWPGNVNLWCWVKPCAAYNVYMEQKVVPAGKATYQLTKKKGFTRSFKASVSVTASVSAGIGFCDSSLEVSAEYSYGEIVEQETTETYSQELPGPAVYNLYQPVIMYANKLPFSQSVQNHLSAELGDSTELIIKDNYLYFFATVHRNSPRTVTTKVNPISLKDLTKKMMNEHFPTWNPNPKDYFYIKSTLTGGRVSLAWDKSVEEIRQNGAKLHMWSGEVKDYEVFELVNNKFLKNVVTKKFVHVRWDNNLEETTKPGAMLHMWNGQVPENQFDFLPDGRIQHAYSKNFWSIAWNQSASEMYGNGAKVHLWNNSIDDSGVKWERVTV